MRTVRASEIGTYLYCQRAWWYQLQGYKSQNDSLMAGGVEFHHRHGQEILISGCLRFLAYVLILLSLALGTVCLTRLFL